MRELMALSSSIIILVVTCVCGLMAAAIVAALWVIAQERKN